MELQAETWNFIKKELWHKPFPVNSTKILKTPFLNRTTPVAASVASSSIKLAINLKVGASLLETILDMPT